jgi:hypothetical protein
MEDSKFLKRAFALMAVAFFFAGMTVPWAWAYLDSILPAWTHIPLAFTSLIIGLLCLALGLASVSLFSDERKKSKTQ